MPVQRKPSADPSKDVGPWKNVESKFPYETWKMPVKGDFLAAVYVQKSGPQSDNKYWAHVELSRKDGGPVSREDEYIAASDSHDKVVEEAIVWMRRNKDWLGAKGAAYGGTYAKDKVHERHDAGEDPSFPDDFYFGGGF